nr:MAG TPA: hypothetical protein [Caudoviricetes sp.]
MIKQSHNHNAALPQFLVKPTPKTKLKTAVSSGHSPQLLRINLSVTFIVMRYSLVDE